MFDYEKRADLNYIDKYVPILYKYTRVENFKAIVSTLGLTFKNPTIFNDPYDCYPGLISFDDVPENFRQNFIEKYRPFLNSEIIKRIETSTDNDVITAFRDLAFPTELSNIAISCFSEKLDNLLMWSHYSDSHKGVCIGFNLRKLYLSLKEYHPALIRVKYTDKLIQTDYFRNPKEAISNWYKIKSDCWSYEKEIRIVLTNLKLDSTKQIFIPIAKDTISSVLLGSIIDPLEESKIKSICLRELANAKVYKMSLKSDSFNLITE